MKIPRIWAWLALALLAILLGVGARFILVPALQPEPAATGSALIGGPFSLTDQTGARRTDADFRGTHMLIFFGYSFCPDVCPTALQNMTVALDALGPKAARVTPIFITIDPARDTVAALGAYAANFHPRLVALTGTEAEIRAVAKAYRVYFAKVGEDGDPDYLVDHTSIVYLMGPDGRYVAHFTHNTSPDELAQALKRHL